jgi:hypothetical protein
MTTARASTVFITDDNTTNGDGIRWISSDIRPDSFMARGTIFRKQVAYL